MMTLDTSLERKLMDAVCTLTPAIRAAREETERVRSLPQNLVQALASEGFFTLFGPRSLGCSELDPLAAARVVEATSTVDSTVGWCVMVASQWSWFTGYLPTQAANTVLSDPAAAIAGQLFTGGEAVKVAGGYRVRGRWPFNSGSSYATWFVEATQLVDGGARLMFIPRSDIEILDTWHVSGLRGTASHDVVVTDVVVPAELTVPWPLVAPVTSGPLYHPYSLRLLFITQAAQAFGVARSAIDTFTELAACTTRKINTTSLREQPSVQAEVARAEAQLAAARAYAYEAGGTVWEQLLAGQEPTERQRAHLRLAITYGIGSAVQVVDAMFTSAGSKAIFSSCLLDQNFRDIHAAAGHVQATPKLYEETGRVFLGLGPPLSAIW